jgi:hypothetical protein
LYCIGGVPYAGAIYAGATTVCVVAVAGATVKAANCIMICAFVSIMRSIFASVVASAAAMIVSVVSPPVLSLSDPDAVALNALYWFVLLYPCCPAVIPCWIASRRLV